MTVATTATFEAGVRLSRTASLAPRPGFAYVALLLVLAGAALAPLKVAESARVARQREAEAQLLFVGRQYRAAIERYTTRDAGALRGPPKKLEDLLADQRLPVPQHDLRRLYPDPFSGRADWDVLRDARGGIVGVRSRSQIAPLQRRGFGPDEAGFGQARTYADWAFTTQSTAAAAAPGGTSR